MFGLCRCSRVIGRSWKRVPPLLKVLRRLFGCRMLDTSFPFRRRSVGKLLVWYRRLRFVVVTRWRILLIGNRRYSLLVPCRFGVRRVFLVVSCFVWRSRPASMFVGRSRRKVLRTLLMRVSLLVVSLCRIRTLRLLFFFVVICRVVVWRGRVRVLRPRRCGCRLVFVSLIGWKMVVFSLMCRVLRLSLRCRVIVWLVPMILSPLLS